MSSTVKVRNDTSPVQQRTGGMRHWLVLVSLLFPFALLAAPAGPAYSIADFVTCKSAKMVPPHDWHVPQAVFRTGDDRFFAWVELNDVSGISPVEMKLYRPDGSYYGEETQLINETNGIASWWRMAAWWSIKDYGPAQTPGRWKLDLVIDGTLQRSIYLTIDSPDPVLADLVKPGATNSVVPAHTIQTRVLASQDAALCILEASSDLGHWIPVQTNAIPISLLPAMTTAKGGFRLILDGSDIRRCIIEASPDLVNWTPIQTNNFPSPSVLDPPDATVVTARFYRAVIQSN
jgi:hypothetical protein